MRLATQKILISEFQVTSGKKLVMKLDTGGEIDIAGWDKEIVSVDVHRKGRDDDRSEVTFDQTSTGVDIRSRYSGWGRSHSSSLKFILHVPKKFDLDLDSKGGGFTVSGVEGQLEGTTMGGALELTQLKGAVNFKQWAGESGSRNRKSTGEVNTNGGKVSLEDVIGNVNGHSMGGAVTYKNVSDRKGNSTGEEVKISTMGGEINVDGRAAWRRCFNNGGRCRGTFRRGVCESKNHGAEILPSITLTDGSVPKRWAGM